MPGESHGQRSLAGYSPQDCKEPNTTEKLTLSLLTTFKFSYILIRVSLVVQMVKNLPAMQETRIQSLGWEDSPGEGNGYPLQYSCLENSMDNYTVHRVAKSWT